MRLNFIQFIYGISSMIALVTFHLLMFKWIIPRIGDTNKVLEFSEENTFRASKIRIVCLHLQLWITVVWLLGTIFLFESTKHSPKEVFLEWRNFLLLVVCFFAVIDLLIHLSLKKAYIFISKKEISFRLSFKKYCLSLDQIDKITGDNRKYNIVTNSGEDVLRC